MPFFVVLVTDSFLTWCDEYSLTGYYVNFSDVANQYKTCKRISRKNGEVTTLIKICCVKLYTPPFFSLGSQTKTSCLRPLHKLKALSIKGFYPKLFLYILACLEGIKPFLFWTWLQYNLMRKLSSYCLLPFHGVWIICNGFL